MELKIIADTATAVDSDTIKRKEMVLKSFILLAIKDGFLI